MKLGVGSRMFMALLLLSLAGFLSWGCAQNIPDDPLGGAGPETVGNPEAGAFAHNASESSRIALRAYFDTLPHNSNLDDNAAILGYFQNHPETFAGASISQDGTLITARYLDGEYLIVQNNESYTTGYGSSAARNPIPDLKPEFSRETLHGDVLPPRVGSSGKSQVVLINAFAADDKNILGDDPQANAAQNNLVLKGFFEQPGRGYSVAVHNVFFSTLNELKTAVRDAGVLVWSGHGGEAEDLGECLRLPWGPTKELEDLDNQGKLRSEGIYVSG